MLKRACKRFLRLSGFVFLGGLLGCFISGCGIKGPLYLPHEKTATMPAGTTPAPETTPSPAEAVPTPASQDATK
ncbi:MAG: lipoprotein [Proteobacteria bacterium]|nr:lipoprotein [Pseudomonadota bacterium]